MQQRSPQAKDTHHPDTPIEPPTEDQLQRLSMLEGTARLRVAERRVRDGLTAPHIDVQRPSESAPLHAPGRVGRYSTKPRSSRLRWVILGVALLLLAAALALKLLR